MAGYLKTLSDIETRSGGMNRRNTNVRNCLPAFTLVELVVAIIIFAVVAAGVLNYQFHAVRQKQMAQAEILATRIGRLVLDDWKNNGGVSDYNPEDLDVGFENTGNNDEYNITTEDLTFLVKLSWQDIEQDTSAGVILREIKVSLQWSNDFRIDTIRDEDPVFVLTTYVRQEGA